MSAQKENRTESRSRGENRNQQTGLVRRSAMPNLPALLLDPLGFFDDGLSLFGGLQDLNRFFNQRGLASQGGRGRDFTISPWVPATEVDYKDGNVVVSAELPGLSENDIKVQVVNDTLIIQGERKDEREENEGGVRRTEIRYGQFYRAIPLPDGAQIDEARAEFDNGVLHVTIPAPNSVKQIPVRATGSTQSGSSQSSTQQAISGQTSGVEKAA